MPKITALPDGTTASGADTTALVQSGATKEVTVNQLMGARTLTAGTGLTGGGALSADRSFAIDATGVTAATYGSATQAPQIAINAQGQITSASNVTIAPTNDVTAASTFGADNRVLRSDGTGRGAQSTGITVDDSNNVTGVVDQTNTGTLTISPTALSSEQSFTTSQSGPDTGTVTGPFIYNQIAVNHNTSVITDTRAMGLYMQSNVGGATQTGGYYGFFSNVNNNANATSNGDYIAVVGQCYLDASTNSGTGEHYGGNFVATAAGAATTPAIHGIEIDTRIDAAATVTRRSGLRIVNEGADVPTDATRDGAIWITGTAGNSAGAFKAGILLTDEMGSVGLLSTGYCIYDGGDAQTLDTFLMCPNVTVSTNIFNFPNFVVTGLGQIFAKTLGSNAPTTMTGTSGSQGNQDGSIIVNASGTFTLTLLAASGQSGRWLYIKTIAAQAVNSASSNVVPLAGGAASTGILAATAGKWAVLQSDGSNWIIMAAN